MHKFIMIPATIVATVSVDCDNLAAFARKTAKSPKAAFAAHNRAYQKRDWKGVYALFSPASQNRMIHLLSTFGILGDKQGKMARIVDKYVDQKKLKKLPNGRKFDKLSRMEQHRLFASCIKDKKKLFTALNQRSDELGTERPALTDLRKLVIRGRKARGIATQTSFAKVAEKKAGGKSVTRREKITANVPVYFIKQNAKWLIATEEEWKSEE